MRPYVEALSEMTPPPPSLLESSPPRDPTFTLVSSVLSQNSHLFLCLSLLLTLRSGTRLISLLSFYVFLLCLFLLCLSPPPPFSRPSSLLPSVSSSFVFPFFHVDPFSFFLPSTSRPLSTSLPLLHPLLGGSSASPTSSVLGASVCVSSLLQSRNLLTLRLPFVRAGGL